MQGDGFWSRPALTGRDSIPATWRSSPRTRHPGLRSRFHEGGCGAAAPAGSRTCVSAVWPQAGHLTSLGPLGGICEISVVLDGGLVHSPVGSIHSVKGARPAGFARGNCRDHEPARPPRDSGPQQETRVPRLPSGVKEAEGLRKAKMKPLWAVHPEAHPRGSVSPSQTRPGSPGPTLGVPPPLPRVPLRPGQPSQASVPVRLGPEPHRPGPGASPRQGPWRGGGGGRRGLALGHSGPHPGMGT